MYKELVSSIESNLKRFVEVPELEDYDSGRVHELEDIEYKITRFSSGEMTVTVTMYSSVYVFKGDWETILARLTELWVNE